MNRFPAGGFFSGLPSWPGIIAIGLVSAMFAAMAVESYLRRDMRMAVEAALLSFGQLVFAAASIYRRLAKSDRPR